MVLIISSISFHVKQKEGGQTAIKRHTLYPSVEPCAALSRLRGLSNEERSACKHLRRGGEETTMTS